MAKRSSKSAPLARTPIRGKTWRKTSTIAADKYAVMSKALLRVLNSKPQKFGEVTRQVAEILPDFDGSVAWYAISVLRELEVQGKVVRNDKPVTYVKPRAPKKRPRTA